jgi:hypothetical protein
VTSTPRELAFHPFEQQESLEFCVLRMGLSKSSSRTRLVVFLLRFLVSKNEYERLEVILSPYTPGAVRAYLPSTADFNQRPRSPARDVTIREAALGTRDEYLPSTVRQGTRVFAATYVLATLVDAVLIGIIKKHGYSLSLAR